MRAHLHRSTRRLALLPGLGVLLGPVLLSSCALPGVDGAASSPAVVENVSAVPASVTWSAAEHAELAAGSDIRVQVTGGLLRALDVIDSAGRHWPTSVAANSGSATGLPPASTLVATATTTGGDGTVTRSVRTVRTVAPPRSLRATITPGDGATVGVGQPVIVTFNSAVRDHAAAERALRVVVDRPIGEAGWYWFNDTQVQYRPKSYWPSGAKVTVTAALT